YPRVSSFDLEAYLDSDYAGANLDRKSTTGGCQFLGRILIPWQCKKQTIVATSTIEAEYVATANCCGDAYEKKLIQVLKIHTDDNVADLLTKAFDVSRFLALEASKDAQAAKIIKLKTRIKKLKKKNHPVNLHTQGHAHGMEYMDIEEAINKKGGSTVSTTRLERVSIAGVTINTANPEISAVEPRTQPTTTSIFDDEDVTMAQTLIKMKEEKAKEKGVAFKDVEYSSRPARSILTLKPLLIIDPKDKDKGVLQEPEPAKKMAKSDFDAAQIARDAEIARQLEVDWQAEEERKR
ncbi:hypothetical protein Tco_0336650, partial [Tanacetum coccineum]